MAQIIASLAEVGGRYDAVFCDLWGCLHNGRAPFPAAVAALQAFRAAGGAVVLLTNAPRPKPSVVAQLDGMGVPRDCWDEVVTSGDAAQYALLSGAVGRRVHHIGTPGKDEAFFTEFAPDLAEYARSQPPILRVPMKEAEGIVCTGLRDDLTETPDDYRAELLMGRTLGLPMLCANPDIVVDFGDRRLWCAGALARDYEEKGGRTLYFGKPHPPIYDLARRRLSALREGDPTVLCIGDGIATDIQGGMGEGLDTLFITGGIDAAAFGPDAAAPDPVLLQHWLDARQMMPTFAMGHLR